jgi:hypothetical protein
MACRALDVEEFLIQKNITSADWDSIRVREGNGDDAGGTLG